MAKKNLKIYSVTNINGLISAVLETELPPKFIVQGQISNWKKYASGHCYPSLKDTDSILPCAMWKSSIARLKFEPEDGMEVLATGSIDVYIPRGEYKFIIDKIQPAGVGALQIAFEQMLKRLTAEGLFDDKHKKPIPQYPMRIGILTSETGAAVQDIRDSIQSRWPCAKLFLYPVPVQGDGAAAKIAQALRDVNRQNKKLKLDVLIVGRGGGSLEDLWAFNEEVLARAIFDSNIPVISAVGHEIDTTIADLVADKRASTPTKAGVAAVPDIIEVLDQLEHIKIRLGSKLHSQIELGNESLARILASAVFKNPLLPIRNRQQHLDEIHATLTADMKTRIADFKESLRQYFEKLASIEPHRLIGRRRLDLTDLKNRMATAAKALTNTSRVTLTAQANRLAALDPRSVLNRGYSITINKRTDTLVKTADDINIGDIIITELAKKNLIESEVKKK